ncbi:DNA replication and repair protein RecF [bacterium]|nr:DNA replication and repair protein RecF [bacterium]
MIKKLKLNNFRKFKDLELEFTSDIIVFHGNNAQGKSSILEALHIICNGNSPWSSGNEYINNKQNGISQHSRIEITTKEHTYAHYKDKNRKTYMIDDSKTTPKKFFINNSATIFNPERIDLLMLSPNQRRTFLDETISAINYEYPSILSKFRKVLKQRNSHLKKLAKKFYEKGIISRHDPQLNFWTLQLSELSSIIYIERLKILEKFSEEKFSLEYDFCNKNLQPIEKIKNKIEEIQKILDLALEDNKKRDIVTGYTNIGPHRDDWNIFTDQDIKKYGSRGQKRLAVGNLVFKSHEIIAKELGYHPILLLDDIASELDIKNTKEVFNKKVLNKQQTFITTVDKKILPKHILENAQFFNLNKY